jgi:signal transduction histidine kinase
MDLLRWLFSSDFKLRSEVYLGSSTIYAFALAILVKLLCYLAIFLFLAQAVRRNRAILHERVIVWMGAFFLASALSHLFELTTALVAPLYNLQTVWELVAIVPVVLFLLHRDQYPALVEATLVRQELVRREAEVAQLQQELSKHTGQVTERTARLERVSYDLQRTNQELEARTNELAALLDVFEVGSMNVSLEDFLGELIVRIVRGMEADLGVVLLKEGHYLVVRASVGITDRAVDGFASPVGDGFIGEVAQKGIPLMIEHVKDDPRADLSYLRGQRVASLLAAPLESQEKVIGVVCIGAAEPHRFTSGEMRRFDGMVQRMAIGVENITMYTELRTKSEELAAKNQELESFVYTVSHDLKTPLVTLQGFVSSLVEDYGSRLDETGQRYLGYVGEAAIRMERLLNGLLNLSRIGRVIHAHTLIPFQDIIDNALVELKPQIEERQVEMRLQSQWPLVFCDRERMTEVMINLLSNAVKFMGPRQSPKIEVGYEERPDYYRFFVRDNGVGIEPVYHQKIFEPFQRLVEVNGAEGTGLGLAIVKKIVEAHGGAVWVESQKSQGSTFYFTIPKRE